MERKGVPGGPMGAPDAILGIAQAFRQCQDPRKVNVCVGAYRDDVNGRSGSVYVFARSGDAWIQTSKFLPPDAIRWGGFGFSLALHGDILVVGACGAAGGR